MIESGCFEMDGLGDGQLPSPERPCFGAALVEEISRCERVDDWGYGDWNMLYIDVCHHCDIGLLAGEDSMVDAL